MQEIHQSFRLYRGLHQGCPLSAPLFVLLNEYLTRRVNINKNIKGIKVDDIEIKKLQLADDTMFLVQDRESIKEVLKELDSLTKLSGLKNNKDKTAVHVIGYNTAPGIGDKTYGLNWKKGNIKTLGVTMTENSDDNYEINYQPKIESCRNLISIWSRRNLTLKGRIVIINTLILPKLIYPCSVLDTPDKVIKDMSGLIDKYLWNWKKPKLRKSVISRKICDGV